jgi:hypothetical protein
VLKLASPPSVSSSSRYGEYSGPPKTSSALALIVISIVPASIADFAAADAEACVAYHSGIESRVKAAPASAGIGASELLSEGMVSEKPLESKQI